jgi:ribose transport system permease protein
MTEYHLQTSTHKSGLKSLGKRLIKYQFLIIIVLFFIFFSMRAEAFLSVTNLLNILEGNAILLILALGMTLVVASGGIDLSVGVALDFGAAFAMVALKEYHVAWQLAVVIAIGGGCLIGLLNSFLVIRLKVSPFLATLGTFFIASSIERIYTEGGGPISFRRVARAYHELAVGNVFGIPTEIVIAAVILLIYYLFLERSIHGKRIHAIGLQQKAALVAGINVNRYLFVAFLVSAATCAVGGVILSANLRQFTPLAGFSYLLDAIGAVFIGASMHPRMRPNVPGTLFGVLFLGMVANGLNLLGLNFQLKDALAGLILVGALVLAVAQQKFRRKSKQIT